jgi:membrane-bound serine protease (ClpP class)
MIYLVIALFILGLSLLITEMIMPGFGLPGIIGIISLIGSVMLTLFVWPLYGIYIAIGIIGVVILVFIILRRWMINKQIYNKIILDDVVQVEKPEYEDLDYFLGKVGITLTPLKPCGTVDFKGVRIETFSVGPYIGAKQKVKVIEISNQKIIVEQVTDTDENSN